MPYLLDTDVVIDCLNRFPVVQPLIMRLQDDGISISVVTYVEVFEGIFRSVDQGAARQRFETFLSFVPVIPFAVFEAETCAQLWADLGRRGRRSRSRYLDLMIAATAVAHKLTLVTRNVADYRDVPGLALVAPEQLEAPQT